MQGNENMNSGNAARLVIYQLSTDAGFRTTPVEAFWRDDKAALGDDLVGRRREVLLYPLQIRFMEVEVEDKANYIAIAANLRKTEGDGWRRIFRLEEVTGERVQIRVAERTLDVSVE